MGQLVAARRSVVLVVDDVKANRELLEAHLFDLGYEVRQARDGVEALGSIAEVEPDLILLDVLMPRLGGLELCMKLKADPARRLIPIILLTVLQDRGTLIKGIEAGADDFLTKPFDPKELLVRTRSLVHTRDLTRQLDASEAVVLALGRVVEAHDMYTERHAERVGLLSRELGVATGLTDPEDLDCLYRGGILHDIGKLVIPAHVLMKDGPLDEKEWDIVRRHSVEGERICRPLRSVAQFLPIIRHHHERWDGSGYPDHLSGERIPLGARIAAVADGWDAMTSDRPYRPALAIDEATRRLREGAGTQWDPAIVDALVGLLDRGALPGVSSLAAPVPA